MTIEIQHKQKNNFIEITLNPASNNAI